MGVIQKLADRDIRGVSEAGKIQISQSDLMLKKLSYNTRSW
jgi:hypothetical protein